MMEYIDIEEYTKNANAAKEIVLSRLVFDNIISKEQYSEYIEKWQIIVVKKSWFKKWWDKFKSNEKDNYIMKFVKFED